jgi:hypothetical protein
MNRTSLILVSLVGIVLLASVVHWYKSNSKSVDSSFPPEYAKRLVEWARRYQSVQPEDIIHIQNAETLQRLFISLKKIPTCRSAKLLAHLYFSIYVERDSKALREFVSLMKEHYTDSYQWDNAFYWKHAEQLLWGTYDTLPSKSSTEDGQGTPKKHSNESKNEKASSFSNDSIKNFKAVVSKSTSKKEI